jgi:hypothetical protein
MARSWQKMSFSDMGLPVLVVVTDCTLSVGVGWHKSAEEQGRRYFADHQTQIRWIP